MGLFQRSFIFEIFEEHDLYENITDPVTLQNLLAVL